MSFTYRGTSSDSMFFNVTERQVYNAPAFDVTAIEVPGRSGDVLNSQQRFKNKTLVYTGFIRSSDFPGSTQWERLSRGLRNIKAWICGDAGKYHDLTDDYDPDYVRRAFVSGETAINILFDRPDGATITITFLAEPFMYEVSEPIEVPESDTASGSIATFEGVNAPLKSLKFYIAPSQDLHGYSYPWPAGGGKNKLPNTAQTATIQGVTFTAKADGTIVANGTSTGWTGLTIGTCTLGAGTWYLQSGVTSGAPNYFLETTIDGVTYGTNTNTTKEIILSAEKTFTVKLFARPGAALSNVVCYPMIRAAGTDATYTPYSNICPISGWTQVDGWQTGGNLLNYDSWKTVGHTRTTAVFENNGVTLTATGTDGFTNFLTADFPAGARIPVKVGEPITLSWDTPDTTVAANVYIFPNGGYTGNVHSAAATKKLTYTPTAGITYVTFRLGVTTNGATVHYKNLMVNFGTAAAAYTPFTGKTPITIALGQTVYGGTVDALAGKCYARPYYASYSGQALVGPWISSHDKYVAGGTPTTGAQVVDMGGAETTLSLTPVSVNSLLGQNNIWANTGETEVEYIVPTENPTQWPSQPRLEITMSGAGTLTVNGKTWSIGAYTGTLICDSEIMDWYDAGALKNSLVSGDGFPELVPGDNVITYTGGITKVVATPRWRTL